MNCFFELIRVAIGTRVGDLYKMAKKQSPVGVCFAALHRHQRDAVSHVDGHNSQNTAEATHCGGHRKLCAEGARSWSAVC